MSMGEIFDRDIEFVTLMNNRFVQRDIIDFCLQDVKDKYKFQGSFIYGGNMDDIS